MTGIPKIDTIRDFQVFIYDKDTYISTYKGKNTFTKYIKQAV